MTYFFKIKSFSSTRVAGFTMIEVFIALLVLTLTFGVGFANYRGFERRKHIEAAATKLKGDILFAKQLAFASKKPTSGCDALDGYTVTLDPDNERYQIQADCSNSDNVSIGKDSLDLGSNIDLKTNINEFTFKVLGHGTTIAPPPAAPVQIQITSKEGINYTLQIEVTSGGEIVDRSVSTLISPTPTPSSGHPTNTPTPLPPGASPTPTSSPSKPTNTPTPSPVPTTPGSIPSPTPTPRK